MEDLGIMNWALDRCSALAALNSFRIADIGVLGGDVYMASGIEINHTYDSWYCNKKVDETEVDFVLRSIVVAEIFISQYSPSVSEVTFSIVPLIKEDKSSLK